MHRRGTLRLVYARDRPVIRWCPRCCWDGKQKMQLAPKFGEQRATVCETSNDAKACRGTDRLKHTNKGEWPRRLCFRDCWREQEHGRMRRVCGIVQLIWWPYMRALWPTCPFNGPRAHFRQGPFARGLARCVSSGAPCQGSNPI